MRLRSFSLLTVLMILLLAAPVFADYPPMVGHLIDGTGLVDQTRFEAAVSPLVSLSAIPFGIAYNESGGVANTHYDAEILNNYGYGVPAESLPAFPGAAPLDPNVVAISIDYGGRNIMVYVGDNWTDEIGYDGINAILDEVAKYAMQDPNAAFEAGFAKAYDLMDPPFNRGVRSFVATAVPLIPFILGGIALIIVFVWLFRKMGQLSRANHEIGLVKAAWDDILLSFDGGKRHLQVVVDLLKDDYGKEATSWTNSVRPSTEQMAGLGHELGRLAVVKLGLFSSNSTIAETVSAYQAVFARFNVVEDWVVAVTNEAKRLEDQCTGAKDLLFRIEPEVARVAGWYEQAQENSRILPTKDNVFGGLQAEVESASQLILYQSHGELRGARILENVRVILEALEKAASIVVTTESFGRETMQAIRDALSSWRTEFPNPDTLAESPLSSLAEAIAYLTDDSDYGDVIPPAEEARARFENLRVEVGDLVASLKLRDEVATYLKSQSDKGFTNQVETLLYEAAQALSAGVMAITAGTLVGVTNNFCLARTKSEMAQKRMVYLVKLCDTNQLRLTDLSQKVAAAEVQRTTQVGPLWNNLQSNFARPNWAEAAEYFELATGLLANLFDNPADSHDLASQVADLNDMTTQKFEDAEKLLNDLFRQYQQAVGLLESVANRHALCVKSRNDHGSALEKAQSRLAEAETYRDTHDADVDSAVDENLEEAKALIKKGQKAASEKNYVLALESADAAVIMVMRALDAAKGQVSELSRLRDLLENTKAEAHEAVDEVSQAIGAEHDSVVTVDTEQALSLARSSLERARTAEAGTARLEDAMLAKSLKGSIAAYDQTSKAAEKAMACLASDQDSYTSLMSVAQSAISSASTAIGEAAGYCNDSRAGNAGDGELSSARSLLPANPARGATRSKLRDSASSANSAKSKAKQAESEARAAIRRYEEAEEARRQAEAARKRAEECARQQSLESARRLSSSSSSSSSHRSGGGISVGRSNSGGMSGGRKF